MKGKPEPLWWRLLWAAVGKAFFSLWSIGFAVRALPQHIPWVVLLCLTGGLAHLTSYAFCLFHHSLQILTGSAAV